MNKKYTIIFVIVLVGAGCFFFYSYKKNEREADIHHKKEYKRMIAAAQKSPAAGLRHMGQALNRYKDKNGDYPVNLSALYPDYIPVKAFIDDIQWHYSREDGDFHLRKSINGPRNKVLTASIKSDLQPQFQSDTMVATKSTPERSPVKDKIRPPTREPREKVAATPAKPPKAIAKTAKPNPQPKRYQNSDNPPEPLETPNSEEPDLETYPTHQLSEKYIFVRHLEGGFLVWKNEDDTLGFGNIQYPLSDQLYIFDKGEWVQIRGHQAQAATSKVLLDNRKK